MALSENKIITNESLLERKAHGSNGFPCAGYERKLECRPGDEMTWHWHPEIEVIFVKEGTIDLRLMSRKISLRKGDFAFINANAMHNASSPVSGVLEICVFSPLLIEGTKSSEIAEKYVEPLIHDTKFTGDRLQVPTEIINHYEKAFQMLKNDETGFEIAIRNALSEIILEAYKIWQPQGDHKPEPYDRDAWRITMMLDFIHIHYREEISLKDICTTVHIGKREALRCFQRTIGESPMQYLIKYRLMNSADELVRHPEEGIAEVAEKCGFSSPSYYTKKFHEFYQCTPSKFVKMNRKDQSCSFLRQTV